MAEIELASEGRGVQRGGPLPAATRRAVMLRDRCRCRVPGCSRRRHVDVHHLVPQASGGVHSRSNCLVLCRTHHHLLHDGKLEVSGDAEGELCFRDLRGVVIELDGGATQGGILRWPVAQVLEVIGRRGGWSLDALIEGSRLPASAVACALTLLELGGRVRSRDFLYDPV